jgi:hypothetical protein
MRTIPETITGSKIPESRSSSAFAEARAEKPLAPLHQLCEIGNEGNASQIGLRAWWLVLLVNMGRSWKRVPFSAMFLAFAKK